MTPVKTNINTVKDKVLDTFGKTNIGSNIQDYLWYEYCSDVMLVVGSVRMDVYNRFRQPILHVGVRYDASSF